MAWTDERIDDLKAMWGEGLTASQIAEKLGGVSRNAVIGKAHRLGLKSRPSPVKSVDKDKKAATKKKTPPRKKVAASDAPAKTAAPKPASTKPAPPESEKFDSPVPNASMPNPAAANKDIARIVSVGPGGFLRQGPGDQQPPIPPAPPRRLVPARPSSEISGKTSLLDLTEKVCRWPINHPGEPDFHFCGRDVNPGFPYCVEHCGRAYQAQLPRGTRRPPPPLPFGGPRVR